METSSGGTLSRAGKWVMPCTRAALSIFFKPTMTTTVPSRFLLSMNSPGRKNSRSSCPYSYGAQLQPFPGLPSVLPDGNLYLPVETAADGSSPDVLQLLKVSPDGTSTWHPVTTVSQCFGPVIEAHEPIPDGQ